MYLTIIPDSARNSQLAHHNAVLKGSAILFFPIVSTVTDVLVTDTIDDAIVFCQTCRHGGHASHILDWFYGGEDGARSHGVCAVADCTHRCGEEF
jgi:hypothetical protein